MKKYFSETVDNMRDIGGYCTKNNEQISYGKIIRSSALTNIQQTQLDELLNLNVNTVIDLRTDEEINKNPTNLNKNPAFKFYHCKINGGDKIPNSQDDVPRSYMNMLQGKESIYQVFKIIEQSDNGVVYFCTAGKDRTGIITALLLDLLGVQEKDIVMDYEMSNTPALEKYKLNTTKEVAEIITPKAKYMETFLKDLKQEYGNAENYLLTIGMKKQELEKIKKKMKKSI